MRDEHGLVLLTWEQTLVRGINLPNHPLVSQRKAILMRAHSDGTARSRANRKQGSQGGAREVRGRGCEMGTVRSYWRGIRRWFGVLISQPLVHCINHRESFTRTVVIFCGQEGSGSSSVEALEPRRCSTARLHIPPTHPPSARGQTHASTLLQLNQPETHLTISLHHTSDTTLGEKRFLVGE